MTPIKLRLIVALLALQAYRRAMSPQPPRQPMKQCTDCSTWNRADADRCIYCNRPI